MNWFSNPHTRPYFLGWCSIGLGLVHVSWVNDRLVGLGQVGSGVKDRNLIWAGCLSIDQVCAVFDLGSDNNELCQF